MSELQVDDLGTLPPLPDLPALPGDDGAGLPDLVPSGFDTPEEGGVDTLPPLPDTGASSIRLSKRQKAAVIVRFLLSQGVNFPLTGLTDSQQTALTFELARMKNIDRATLESVVEDFTSSIDDLGLSFPAGLDEALGVLDGTISDSTARRIRAEAGLHESDPWERLNKMEGEKLLPAMEQESIEVAAVLLSKLKTPIAAQLLGQLPGERARRITFAVSQTSHVTPQTVRAIGSALLQQLDDVKPTAFDAGPVDRVGAILNSAASMTREDMLVGLDEKDELFASEVRKIIFTFSNIPDRIDARDIAKIMRDVDQKDLICAIAAAKDDDEKAAEFLLSNISQRMADNLREEAKTLGKPSPKEADAAMSAIVNIIRDLEASGEIFLLTGDSDEAEN